MSEHTAELMAWYEVAYVTYAEWVAALRTMPEPIAAETVMVCERLPEMASAIFAAGYVAAMADAAPRQPGPAEAGRG